MELTQTSYNRLRKEYSNKGMKAELEALEKEFAELLDSLTDYKVGDIIDTGQGKIRITQLKLYSMFGQTIKFIGKNVDTGEKVEIWEHDLPENAEYTELLRKMFPMFKK